MPDPPSWGLLDEDFNDISDWEDIDRESGESSVDPAGQLKLLTGATTNYPHALRRRDIGEFPNTFTLEVKIYHDAIGTLTDEDRAEINYYQADEFLRIAFCSDGLLIEDTDSGWTEVGTDLVKEGGSAEWQTWRFLVTFTGTTGEGTCDVYLKDTAHPNWAKVGTAIPCSKEAAGTDGRINLIQYGYITADLITHADYIKVATGLYSPIEILVAASGQAASEGSVAGLLALIGDASGQGTSSGEVAGLLALIGGAEGQTTSTGDAGGLLGLRGDAEGQVTSSGDAAGHIGHPASAEGQVTSSGIASALLALVGQAEGQEASQGTIYALLTLIGGASGQVTSSGEAAALFGYVVSATGAATSQGAAAALLELVGRATGLAVTTWDIIMINFTGDLAPGETLVIDHKAKTVTIDGVNVLKYFTTGDFPNLPPGGSMVKYADTEDSRDLTITVTWKDKWL